MSDSDGWIPVEVQNLASSSRHSFTDGDWIEAPYITDTGIRLIQTGNIGIGVFIDKNKKFISEASFAELKCKEVYAGDILICRLADPIGRSCVVPDLNSRAITSVDVCILRVEDKKYDRDYITHALNQKSFLDACQENAAGSTRQRISRTNLGKLKLLVPNFKPEQTKIAEVLSTVDRAIEQTEALIAKQQRIKTGLMQDLLTHGIDEHDNLRSEQTHKFKYSPLGRIPVEWEVKRLGESSEVCNSFRKPIAALVRENMKGDYPYYGPTGILDYIREYRVNGKFVLIGEDGDHFLKFKTQEMTLLVEGKYNVNNHAHILQGKGNVLTEWLHLFFLHRDITLHLTRQGAGRFKLNKAALLELLLSVPKEPAEQDRILKLMNTLRQNQISSIENLAKLRSLKIALMQDLLTGKKRVTALLHDTEVVHG